jgi:hypothetical protein
MSILSVVSVLFISFINTRILTSVQCSISTVYILIYLAIFSQLHRLCYMEPNGRMIMGDVLERISEKC